MRTPARIFIVAGALSTGLLVAWWWSSAKGNSAHEDAMPRSAASVAPANSRSIPLAATEGSPAEGSGSACEGEKIFPARHRKESATLTQTAASAYEMSRGRMPEIYAAEARAEPWATRREHEMLSYTEQDIRNVDPNARTEVECHASSCRIRIYSEKTHLVEAMGDYPFACAARYSSAELGMGQPGSRYADFYVLFGEQNLDDDAFLANRERTCPRYRQEWLSFVSKPFK
jgi:hypothetical protein